MYKRPIDADPHRAVIVRGNLNHGRKLCIAPLTVADIAWIDTVFGQSIGAGRIISEQRMTIVMEVPNQRHIDAHFIQRVAYIRHRGGGLGAVNCNPDQF